MVDRTEAQPIVPCVVVCGEVGVTATMMMARVVAMPRGAVSVRIRVAGAVSAMVSADASAPASTATPVPAGCPTARVYATSSCVDRLRETTQADDQDRHQQRT
jgi:hypothetical protein